MADVQKTFDEIKTFSMTEVAELVKMFEEEFDISAAAPVAVAAAPAAAEGGGEEEKSSFDVVLTVVGDKKIQVIKVVRAVTGLGLKEAKELVDNAPNPVKEGVARDEADKIKEQIEEAGGSVSVA